MIEGYNDYTQEILAQNKGLEKALTEAKTSEEIDDVFQKYGILNIEYKIKLLHLIHGADRVTHGIPTVEHCKIEDCYEFDKAVFLTDPGHRRKVEAYAKLEEAGLIFSKGKKEKTKKEVKSITRKEVLELADILTKQFMGNLKTEVSKAVDKKLKEKE